MFIYVGRRYTATVQGSVWKPVTCEFCGLDWAYQMTRKAEGTGSSPYFLDNEGAHERASREARQSLAQKLEHDVDVVGCPSCARLQKHMFRKARMHAYGHWYLFAAITALVGVIFCGVWGSQPWLQNWVSPPGVFIFAAALVMGLSAIIRSRLFDPNEAAQVRSRKRKRPSNNLMLRTDYEAAIEAAIAKGGERSRLLTIEWPSSASVPRRRADGRERLARPPSAEAA